MSTLVNKETCPECGPAPVNHRLHYWGAVSDRMLMPVTKFFLGIEHGITPLTRAAGNFFGTLFVKTALALRLGTLTTDLDNKDSLRTKALWESAKKRGIRMEELRFLGRPGSNLFSAVYGSEKIFFDGLPLPRDASTRSLAWLDDKSIMQRRFRQAGIAVPKGGTAFTFAHAKKLFNEIGGTAIVKPRMGSRSRHTFINISSVTELERAWKSAQLLSPWVMVQEELVGRVYRGTVIAGKVAGVIRRDPPGVTGDGRRTVRDLIANENENPLRHGTIFHTLAAPEDPETAHELEMQDLTAESIPENDRFVTLNPKVSRGCGAATTDVTDIVHPDTILMLERAAEVLDSSLVGIDFIIGDIARSWKDQEKCGVIECNAVPYIDLHHYPLFGKPRDVAGILWESVFPELRESR